MSSNYLEKIIYLSQEDYETLLSNNGTGTVTKNGRTLTGINPNYIYITDETDISTITGLQEALNNVTLPHKLTFGAGGVYQYDGSADVTVPVYTGGIY